MFEPVVTATTHPGPRAQIVFESFPAGTVRATVRREFSGQVEDVRDGELVFAAGGLTVTDYEIPLVPTAYWAEMFDAAGLPLGETDRTSVTLYGEQGYGWWSDPLVPEHVVQVPLGGSFGESLSKKRDMSGHRVGGQTIFLMGSMGLLEGLNLETKTDTLEQADMLQKVLQGSFCLLRTTPRIRIPACLYVAVQMVPEVEENVQYGGERINWPISGDEMSRHTIGVALPVAPYQTYMNAFATYADAMAAYSTYLDAMKNPPGV
jgi:hypothetical protein